MVFVGIEQRKLDHIWRAFRLFPRCVVRQFQEKQPFIRPERPQLELRRLIAGFDETRILHLFDVFVILRSLHCVRSASSVS